MYTCILCILKNGRTCIYVLDVLLLEPGRSKVSIFKKTCSHDHAAVPYGFQLLLKNGTCRQAVTMCKGRRQLQGAVWLENCEESGIKI